MVAIVSMMNHSSSSLRSSPATAGATSSSQQKSTDLLGKHLVGKRPLGQTSSSETTPAQLLRQIFAEATTATTPSGPEMKMTATPLSSASSPSTHRFHKPSEENLKSYDLEAVRAIRSKDLAKLKKLHQAGKNLNACNQFGESLLHMACRRGNLDILKYMIHEAKVSVAIADDFGRNCVHDAAWTPSPNFDVMDLLLDVVDPAMLIAPDVRGSTPFEYARKEHHASWIGFLEARRDKLTQRILQHQEAGESSPSCGKEEEDIHMMETS
jgi:hypothetical protein